MDIVSLFAPSTTAPGDYTSRAAELARQQKLADMLSQMSQQEIPVSTAGGISAPVSPMSALAKGLTSFGGSYLAGKAAADEAALKKSGNEQLVRAISEFGQPYKTVDTAASAADLGGEPIQQYTMKTPTSQEQMGQAAGIMSSGLPGAEAIGSSLFSNLVKQQAADAELKKQYARLQPVIAALPKDQQDRINSIAASDPESATKIIQSITESQFKPPEKTEISRLITERDALPPNDPRRAAYDEKLSGVKSPEAEAQAIRIAKQNAQNRFVIQAGPPEAPITVDPTSKSLNGVTGLSQLAIDRLTGAPNQPRSAAVVRAVDKEISDYSVRNNVNLSTLRSKAAGIQNTLTNNVERNNQANILEQELAASIDTVTPYLNKVNINNLNKANILSVWAGKQVNDPNAQVVADQLARARDELAGYNAVAGGHLTVQGRPDPTPKNYQDAEKTLLDGITAGGAAALAKSVSLSAQKNRQILNKSIQQADYQLWDALGKGEEYKKNFGYDPEKNVNKNVSGQTKTGVGFKILGQ